MGAGNTDDAAGARSDTVMLVNIPANRKRVVAVSFPRDLAITPMQVRAVEPRDRRVRPALRRRDTESYGPDEVYTETKLNSAYAVRRTEVPGQGDPETVRPVRKPVHGSRFRRLLQDGRRTRRRRGVQHHPAGGLRTGHRAGQRRPPDRRRPHRAAVRARPPGHHRDQRRLRPHQAPAAVPVVAAALADLQGSVLLAVQAQQRRQHVHRRQLRRQHQDQGPRRPRPVHSGRERRPDHLRHRADRRHTPTSTATRRRAPTTCGHCSTRSSTTTRCPRRRTPTTRRCPGRPSRRRARRRTPTRRTSPTSPSRDAELVDAVTTNPQDITVRVSNSTGEDGLAATAASELQTARLQRHHTRRLPRAAELDDGVLLAGQRAGRRDGRLVVHQPHHRTGHRHGRRGAGGARVATSTR